MGSLAPGIASRNTLVYGRLGFGSSVWGESDYGVFAGGFVLVFGVAGLGGGNAVPGLVAVGAGELVWGYGCGGAAGELDCGLVGVGHEVGVPVGVLAAAAGGDDQVGVAVGEPGDGGFAGLAGSATDGVQDQDVHAHELAAAAADLAVHASVGLPLHPA